MMELTKIGYYHADSSVEKAENILMNKPKGSYLLRPSTCTSACCTLSMKVSPTEVRHVRIKMDSSNHFMLDGYCRKSSTKFESIQQLLTACHNRGIWYQELTRNADSYGSSAKVHTLLLTHPIPCKSAELWKDVL